MSLIDSVLKPPKLSWFKAAGRAAEPAQAPHVPSLAAVEYELMQLRAMLREVVDFKDEAEPAPAYQAIAAKPLPPRRRV